MLIETSKDYYENLITDKDFLEVISKKISYEFAEELSRRLELVQEELEFLRNDTGDTDFAFIEQENEELRNLIDDVNSDLQCYLDPIEKGKRVNRENLIKTFNRIIKKLDGAR